MMPLRTYCESVYTSTVHHRGELHPIVGGRRLAAEYLALGVAVLQHGAPAARTRIALACAVRVDHHRAAHAACLLASGEVRCIAGVDSRTCGAAATRAF